MNSHPDDKQAVYDALDQHDLASVMVNQDRDKGVIKLSGIVGSVDSKDRALQLAQQAAPGYAIDNRLQVQQTNLVNPPKPGNDQNPDGSTTTAEAKPKPGTPSHHR